MLQVRKDLSYLDSVRMSDVFLIMMDSLAQDIKIPRIRLELSTTGGAFIRSIKKVNEGFLWWGKGFESTLENNKRAKGMDYDEFYNEAHYDKLERDAVDENANVTRGNVNDFGAFNLEADPVE